MPPSADSRYRRRVLGAGGLIAFLLYVIGAPVFNNRIENDLETRVPAALAAAGYDGLDAKFSGQEGRLSCAVPLADPEGALAVARGVHGVYSVELDRACRVNMLGDGGADVSLPSATAVTAPGSSGPATTGPAFASVGAVLDGDPQFGSLARLVGESDLSATLADPAGAPVTVFAPTDAAFDALPAGVVGQLDEDAALRAVLTRRHVVDQRLDAAALAALDGSSVTNIDGADLAVAVDGTVVTIDGVPVGSPIETANGIVYALDQVLVPAELDVVATGAAVAGTLAGGTLTLTGTVADAAARDALVFAGTAAVGPDRLDNQLTLDPSGLDAELAVQLAALITALDTELVAGEAGYDGTGLYLAGAFANSADAIRAEAAARDAGAVTDLEPRPSATAAQAAALETELNTLVRERPITFAQGSAVLDESAIAIIDELAARLVEFGGITTLVEGHTDSDGSASTNQALSEQRAGSVRQALVDRGVADETISSEGFGSQRPVLGSSGIEDKTASRRVEFRITAG